MGEETGLAVLLRGAETSTGSFRHLRAFGLLDRTCHPDHVLRGTHEILARAIHEEYLRQQRDAKVTPEQNPSMVPWGALPDHLKESNRQQADDIGTKLKAVRCGVAPMLDWDEPLFTFDTRRDRPPRVYGTRPVDASQVRRRVGSHGRHRDNSTKTHPCLLPFDQLPPAEQEKDRNAVRQIPSTLAKVGFRIHRLKGRQSS